MQRSGGGVRHGTSRPATASHTRTWPRHDDSKASYRLSDRIRTAACEPGKRFFCSANPTGCIAGAASQTSNFGPIKIRGGCVPGAANGGAMWLRQVVPDETRVALFFFSALKDKIRCARLMNQALLKTDQLKGPGRESLRLDRLGD